MSDASDKKKNIKQRLGDRYRLVIIDDDTLGEKKSMRFTMLGLFSGLIAFVILTVGLSYALIAFTPIKYLVPGYGELESNSVYIDLNKKIEILEKDINDQRVYTEGIKNMLNPYALKADSTTSNTTNSRNFRSNDRKNDNLSNTSSLEHYYFCSPLKGNVSAEFDINIKHYGIDIVAAKDSPVKSVLNGVVINADYSTKTGNTISVQHGDNIVSVYKHNSALLKKIGDQVSACDAIAIIGNTGKLTSGPHVHFELWKNGIAIDPAEYIEFNY